MTRIFAAVLLCAASSIGCSALDTMNAQSPKPAHLVNSHSAPRPEIQRAGFHQPAVGAMDLECPYGGQPGMGLTGYDGTGVVNGCVDAVLDCNGCGMGCGDACGAGGCGGPGLGHNHACGCGGQGRCGVCVKLRHALAGGCHCQGQGKCKCCRMVRNVLAASCCCGGAGQCPCCQYVRTCIGGPIAGGTDAVYNFNPGPTSGQVAYPYYTTRGPRDFFLDNPPSIGPY